MCGIIPTLIIHGSVKLCNAICAVFVSRFIIPPAAGSSFSTHTTSPTQSRRPTNTKQLTLASDPKTTQLSPYFYPSSHYIYFPRDAVAFDSRHTLSIMSVLTLSQLNTSFHRSMPFPDYQVNWPIQTITPLTHYK